MRILRYLVFGAVGIVLVVFAIANREPVVLRPLPPELAEFLGVDLGLELPVFLVLFLGILLGLFLGFVWEWLREHRHRADAARRRREVEALRQEVESLRSVKESGPADDVLALVEGAGRRRKA
ncbi:MAG: DUF1049 domain-containing protein [Alphaproteobacteria bacterium]|nr:MAG: DUF1049 domain-containing protein [Alphaproteobacteria bacterium]